jgi:hypothetical protein
LVRRGGFGFSVCVRPAPFVMSPVYFASRLPPVTPHTLPRDRSHASPLSKEFQTFPCGIVVLAYELAPAV